MIKAFLKAVQTLVRHRHLILELAKREITDRYSGQLLGAIWAIAHPVIQIAVYVFVFGYVFRTRIGGTAEMPLDYTTYLLAGLIPWLAFQEVMAKSTTVIVGNANLVKQVVFPTEVLPVKGVVASVITQVIFLGLLAAYVLVSHGSLPWTYGLVPLLLVVQVAAMIGLSYALGVIGVFFRDAKDLVQVFAVVGVYLMPVVFLPQSVPEVFRPFLYLNPFSYVVWCFQDLLYFGRFEHPWAWPVTVLGSLLVFAGGYRLFNKVKIVFSSAL